MPDTVLELRISQGRQGHTPPMKVRLLAGKEYIINTQQSKLLILHYKQYGQKLEQGMLGRT